MTYTSHADLGGQPGFGPILPDDNALPLHEKWEERALAIVVAMGTSGKWNIDMSRSARETLPDYPQLSYFQIWIEGLQRLLLAQGLVDADEIAAGHALHPPVPIKRVLHAADVPDVLARGGPTERVVDGAAPARFSIGQAVRARSGAILHHSRLPGYVRGKRGVVERVNGLHVFPDTNAQGLGEQPQWLYTVQFDGAELWGDASGIKVAVDAWESYLEPA